MDLIVMPQASSKSLMRSLGEFFGHIIKGARTEPSRKVLKKTVEEEKQGNITLRRTTIEEIEINQNASGRSSESAGD